MSFGCWQSPSNQACDANVINGFLVRRLKVNKDGSARTYWAVASQGDCSGWNFSEVSLAGGKIPLTLWNVKTWVRAGVILNAVSDGKVWKGQAGQWVERGPNIQSVNLPLSSQLYMSTTPHPAVPPWATQLGSTSVVPKLIIAAPLSELGSRWQNASCSDAVAIHSQIWRSNMSLSIW